jgi:hypothetical protein
MITEVKEFRLIQRAILYIFVPLIIIHLMIRCFNCPNTRFIISNKQTPRPMRYVKLQTHLEKYVYSNLKYTFPFLCSTQILPQLLHVILCLASGASLFYYPV